MRNESEAACDVHGGFTDLRDLFWRPDRNQSEPRATRKHLTDFKWKPWRRSSLFHPSKIMMLFISFHSSQWADASETMNIKGRQQSSALKSDVAETWTGLCLSACFRDNRDVRCEGRLVMPGTEGCRTSTLSLALHVHTHFYFVGNSALSCHKEREPELGAWKIKHRFSLWSTKNKMTFIPRSDLWWGLQG